MDIFAFYHIKYPVYPLEEKILCYACGKKWQKKNQILIMNFDEINRYEMM